MSGELRKALMAQVRSLRSAVEASAAVCDAASELSAEVREAVDASDLLRLMAPRAVGGLEAQPDVLIDVVRELSYYDGSVGWCVGIQICAGALIGAFFGDEAIETVFTNRGVARAAGQAAPCGKAERTHDGYRIAGSFRFASASPSADWLIGGYLLHEKGRQVMDDHGHPRVLCAIVPRSGVEFLGKWDAYGLKATGSYDFRVLEQSIHQDFAFDLSAPEVRRGGPLYRMGFLAIAAMTHGSMAIGCGRRALDEWAEWAQRKVRPGRGPANELHTVQRDLAAAHGSVRAAESYLRSTYAAIYDCASNGGPIPPALRLDGRLSASQATLAASRAAHAAFASCTTDALRNPSVLQRCHRDLHAAACHTMTGEESLIDVGAVLAGAPGASIAF